MNRENNPDLERLAGRIRECLKRGQKVAVLGVGTELRRDDFAGVRVAMEVQARGHTLIKGFAGHSSPENITSEIIRFAPALTVLVDAAALGLEPGEVRLINRADIGGLNCSGHALPLNLVLDYLEQGCGCEVMVLGIQPGDVSFGEGLTPALEAAVAMCVGVICGEGHRSTRKPKG